MILHFGGVSVEKPFEEVLGPNIRGLYHIYEAARREGARVLFASSNHAIGFHERSVPLDDDCQFMPDGYYGLSKVYGEGMGRLYWYKHGVESVLVRIGSCFPEPTEERMLSTWLSYADLCRLCERATLAPRTGCCVIWGASNNSRSFWRRDARDADRLAAAGQRRRLCRARDGQDQRRSGGRTLPGRRLHAHGLHARRPAAGQIVRSLAELSCHA